MTAKTAEVEKKIAKKEKQIANNKFLTERLDRKLDKLTPETFEGFEKIFLRLQDQGDRLSDELASLQREKAELNKNFLKKKARSM